MIDSLRRDGAQRALIHLVAGLSARDYIQRVYCLNDAFNPDFVDQLKNVGAEAKIVGKVKLLTWGLVGILNDLRHWKPHIVQTLLPYADNIGRTLAKAAGIPVIVSSIRTRNIDKPAWQFFLDRMTTPWATRVVFNCRTAIAFACQHEGVSEDQVVYIPNGVRIPVQDALSREKTRSDLGVVPETQVIGTVGRLYPQKGHAHLLRAFTKVLEDRKDVLLLIVGNGPLLDALKSDAAGLGILEHLRFLGERQDVPDLLSCMDLYVQASLFEGMPNAVMEAMASGKPVIASAVDGVAELITHGLTGWLTEPGDEIALADTMLRALDNPKEAKHLGDAARKRVFEEFSLEKMVSSYDELYRSLIASG